MKPILVLIPVCGLLLFSCQRETVAPDNTPNVRALRVGEAKAVSASTAFAFDTFARLNDLKPADQNQFVSPFSVAMAVAMTKNGADGTTKDGIGKALRLDGLTDEELNASFRSLSEYLNGIDRTVNFSPANSIWYRNTLTPRPDFVRTNQTHFNAEVRGMNFDDPATVNVINAWAKEKTQGKIDNVINQIDPEHLMFLINAIYFKGTWTYQFDKSQTRENDFLAETGGPVKVPFMITKGDLALYQDQDKILVELPYGNRQFVMTLVMPASDKKMSDLLPQLNAKNFDEWLQKSRVAGVQVVMPKFSFRGNYMENEFGGILAKMGMGEAFSFKANFSRMFADPSVVERLRPRINSVNHKSFIELDEEGTEAAAVTVVAMIGRVNEVSPPVPPTFVFNRPFVYLIREKNSGAILFMGKMMRP
jgi:serpin B